MEISLFFAGFFFFATGLYLLIKSNFSEASRYSWKMGLFAGGIAWMGFYLLLSNNGKMLLSLPGSGIFSIILGALGMGLLIWRSTVANVIYKLQLPGFRFFFGSLIDWNNPWIPKLYKWGITFAGVILLLAAYANYFGPVEL